MQCFYYKQCFYIKYRPHKQYSLMKLHSQSLLWIWIHSALDKKTWRMENLTFIPINAPTFNKFSNTATAMVKMSTCNSRNIVPLSFNLDFMGIMYFFVYIFFFPQDSNVHKMMWEHTVTIAKSLTHKVTTSLNLQIPPVT